MAHSACCLIVLCLSIVLHPALAQQNAAQRPLSRRLFQIPSIVLQTQGNPLLKQLCTDKKHSDLCSKIFKEDDKENWAKLKANKHPEISIDFALAVAIKSSDYMGNQLNSTKLDQSVAPSLQVCQRYYNDIIVDLENASQDLKENPAAAKGFLDDAGYKVGFCNASKIPQILQINGIILRLVRNAAEHVKHSDDPEPIFNFNF